MRWNLYTRADTPYYQCRVVLADGSELKRSTRLKDRAAAEEWGKKWAEELEWREKLGLSSQTVTVEKCWEEMIKMLPEHKVSYYATSYRNHIQPKFGSKPIDQIKTPELKLWIQGLKMSLSDSRVAAIGVVMRQILKFAIDRDWLKEGAAAKVPPTSYRSGQREAFTEDEVKALLKFLREDRGGGWKKTDQDSRTLLYYYVAFLVYTQARPGRELETLTWQRITEDRQHNRPYLRIRILRENTKVRREREIVSNSELVPIMDELRDIQREWGNYRPTGFVFADRRGMVRRFSNEIFSRALDRAGLKFTPDGKARQLYSLRHAAITRYVKKGIPLTAIALNAGTSPAMISHHYSKAIPRDFIDNFLD